LLFAAGQLRGIMPGARSQTDPFQQRLTWLQETQSEYPHCCSY
jgi:hypothetical protein